MAGAHRSASPSFWRPTSGILGALFTGSAVMFTAVAVQGGSPFVTEGPGTVAGPLPEETATRPSPETAAVSPGGSLHTAGNGVPPVIALPSAGTATRPSPAKTRPREVPAVAELATDQPARWAPGATADRDTPLPAELVPQAPVPMESEPALAPQDEPPAGDTDQADHRLIENLLGDLGLGL